MEQSDVVQSEYLKIVETLVKLFGPSDELKKRFYATSLGSLMGQTVLLLGLLVIYSGTCAILVWLAPPFFQVHLKENPILFVGFLIIPFALILLFIGLPAVVRELRERRLKAMAIGAIPKPGYFRLQPYGPADREAFKRLDGTDAEVLNWLKSTKSSLLYFSGASGVGKSSLLSAGVIPKLREEGWKPIETRVFGDPIERVRHAIMGGERLFDRKPTDTVPLTELLKKAAAANAKTRSGALLLVIDQFEEFLILRDDADANGRNLFTALLTDLATNPIVGLRVLLVFRSDYVPLVFKLGLPPLVWGDNWYQLAPYNRSEATELLQGGGRQLAPDTLDAPISRP